MLHLWNALAPLLVLDCYYKSAECEESASVNFLKSIFQSNGPTNKTAEILLLLAQGVLLLKSLVHRLATFPFIHPSVYIA